MPTIQKSIILYDDSTPPVALAAVTVGYTDATPAVVQSITTEVYPTPTGDEAKVTYIPGAVPQVRVDTLPAGGQIVDPGGDVLTPG